MEYENVGTEAVSSAKKNNEASALGWLFLITMILHVLQALGFGLLNQKGIKAPVEISLFISELLFLLPSVIYVLFKKLSFRKDLGFRPIKAGTFFMCLLLSLLVLPIASFFNVLSQLFVSNEMVQMSDELMSGSSVGVVLIGAVLAPFCEEVVFRSVLFKGYEKVAGPLVATLLSSLLFALAHLNFNQACYVFVLAFIFSVINKAAGSVYPSIIVHVAINAVNLIAMIAMTSAYEAMGMNVDLATAAESTRNSDMIYVLIGTTLVVALICTLIAIPCVVFLAKNEGRLEELKGMFGKDHAKGRWLTVSLVLGICFVMIIIFGLDPLLKLLKVV